MISCVVVQLPILGIEPSPLVSHLFTHVEETCTHFFHRAALEEMNRYQKRVDREDFSSTQASEILVVWRSLIIFAYMTGLDSYRALKCLKFVFHWTWCWWRLSNPPSSRPFCSILSAVTTSICHLSCLQLWYRHCCGLLLLWRLFCGNSFGAISEHDWNCSLVSVTQLKLSQQLKE